MEEAGFILQMVFAFGGGLLSFFSPCVLPLLPGYLGLMSGYSAAELQATGVKSTTRPNTQKSVAEKAAVGADTVIGQPSTGVGLLEADKPSTQTATVTASPETQRVSIKRMLAVTSLFVLGFTIVFVATGAVATSLGGYLVRNQLIVERIAGLVIIAFGLLVLGMALLGGNLFSFFARERRVSVRPSRLGALAPPVMGMAFGFGWTPCIGPILGVVLTTAATQDAVVQGMLLLFSFSVGIGVPFILAGIGLGKAFQAMRFLRQYLVYINVSSGLMLLWFGWIMWSERLGPVSGWFVDLLEEIPLLNRLTEI